MPDTPPPREPPNLLSARSSGPPPRLPLSPVARGVLGVVPLLAAFGLHWALWPYVRPNVWFLFFPAMFLSSWLAGLAQSVAMTVISGIAIWRVLVPVEDANADELSNVFPVLVFIATGVLFAAFHDRLKQGAARLARTASERQIFAELVDNSTDFIGIADVTGRPIYVNPAGRRMIGLAADYPIGTTTIPEYYPDDQRALATDVILKSMVEKGHWHGETAFRHWQTGAAIPVSDTHFMIRAPDTGKILGMGTVTRDISELKRLELSLRETSVDLARAQAVAEVGSWRFDRRTGDLRWSDETYRIFGLPAGRPMDYEEFLGRVHPEDRGYVEARWQAALRGAPYDIEHRIVIDGEVRWVREKAELAFDAQGAPLAGIGIVQNVTARRRLEDELRLAEARSSGIVSISADAIISIDDDQRIAMFNEGAERIFGYTASEVIGASLDALIPDWARSAHREHVAKFAVGPGTSRRMGERNSVIKGRRKTGEEFPADASISKLEVGGTRVLTVSLRDVTEERRADTEHRLLADIGALVGSTLDYEQVLTNLADAIVRELADFCVIDMLDEHGAIHRHKVTCRDHADAWIADVLERVPIDPQHPYLTGDVLKTRRPALLQVIPPGQLEAFSRGEEHLAAFRAMQPRSVVLVPLIARDTLIGALGLVSARSSRTYGQADVALAEELARRAALSIDNARLYSASRLAIRSRDDVLGIVAHDLRNPLNAIILHAALIHKRGDEQQQRRSESIERSARRMDRLIQDLLDVTRMESGHLTIDQTRVATRAVISESLDAQRALAQAAKLDLHLEAPGDLPDIWADRDRVIQVLENLIGNACKFTPAGGHIVVGAARRDGDVVFSVADTGRGIAPEHQQHVFDRFWQTREARRGGAGLGLPIVKGIVEAHGGRIWLESTPGRGTTFYFTIPVFPPQERRHPAHAAA